MPREQINHPEPHDVVQGAIEDGVLIAGEPIIRTETAVHVSWQRGLHVQVALEADPSYLRFCADNPNEPSGRTGVWSPVLDPDELDHLIYTLRRARKAAYGTPRQSGVPEVTAQPGFSERLA